MLKLGVKRLRRILLTFALKEKEFVKVEEKRLYYFLQNLPVYNCAFRIHPPFLWSCIKTRNPILNITC